MVHLIAVGLPLAGFLSPVLVADTWYVDDDAPTRLAACKEAIAGSMEDGSVNHPFGTIQKAIDCAADGDEIIVGTGIYVETINLGGKAIRLRSSGGSDVTILDGNRAGTVVTCASGEGPATVLDGFTITGGTGTRTETEFFPHRVMVSYLGGGLYNGGSSPTVINCTFTRNSADLGGGMYNSIGSGPIVQSCTFESNSASRGAGMFNKTAGAKVTQCVFSSNCAAEDGGGMFDENSNSTVVACAFVGNSSRFGGGMHLRVSKTVVSDCIFTGNVANSRGAGIHIFASDPEVMNCQFRENRGVVYGGAICSEHGNPKVTNCSFVANIAHINYGMGGAMYNAEGSPVVTDCTFTANSARRGGAMANARRGDAKVTRCTFTANTAVYDSGGGQGGGLYNCDDSSPVISDCEFNRNSADSEMFQGGGGGVYNYSGGRPMVVNCLFRGNTGIRGGGVYSTLGGPTVINCAFTGNAATFSGGGMYNLESSPTVINCTFAKNFISRTSYFLDGGGVCNDKNSNPIITNCIVWFNSPNSICDHEQAATIVSYSDVEDEWPRAGSNNIDADPLFHRDPDPGADGQWSTDDDDYGDLRLLPGSPCIDAGNGEAPGAGIERDLDGAARVVCGLRGAGVVGGPPPIVDMGAYELQSTTVQP